MSSYCGEILEIFYVTDIYICRLIVEKSSKYFTERTYIHVVLLWRNPRNISRNGHIYVVLLWRNPRNISRNGHIYSCHFLIHRVQSNEIVEGQCCNTKQHNSTKKYKYIIILSHTLLISLLK